MHHDPDRALSDGIQSLYPEQFDELMETGPADRSGCGTDGAGDRHARAGGGTAGGSAEGCILNQSISLKKFLFLAVLLPVVGALAWWYFHERQLPAYGPAYREYAYVTNGKSNTVSVIDLRTFQPAKTIRVGSEPTGIAANGKKNELYVVNTQSNSVSVIDAERNELVATIGVHASPYFIDVSVDGQRGYVANSKSANVSVLDLEKRLVLGNIRVGASPGLARVSPDGSTVVVSNRGDNTASLIDAAQLKVRSTIPVCQEPQDIAILPDNSKAFIACGGSGQVASIDLKTDKLLALLDVGKTPVSRRSSLMAANWQLLISIPTMFRSSRRQPTK